MMPYFKHPVDYDINDILAYMDRLFDCVDRVQIFRILGGEPFIYPDLDKVIDNALSCSKVKTVEIVTNGTIVPKPQLFNHMKNPRLLAQISDYGQHSRQKIALKKACDQNGVRCIIRDENEKTWSDAGGLENRHRTPKELKKQIKRCGNICRSFLNGRLYYCPRASFGAQLGIPDPSKEHVDFREEKPRDQLRQEIYQLNQRKILTACDYCNEGTKDYVPVPVAEQFKNGEDCSVETLLNTK